MTVLKALADKQDLILLAEIGALIHDLGKLSQEFVENINTDAPDMHYHILCLHSRCPEPPGTVKLRNYGGDWCRLITEEVKQWLQDISTGDSANDTKIVRGIEDHLRGVTTDRVLDKVQRFLGSLKAGRVMPTGQRLKKAYIEKLASDDRIEHLSEEIKRTVREITGHQKRFEREKLVPADFLPSRADLADLLYKLTLHLNGDKARLSHYIEMHHGNHWDIPYLVRLLKADSDPWEGVDGFDSSVDKGQVSNKAKQTVSRTLIATAFGYESGSQRIALEALADVRHRYANSLAKALQRVKEAEGKLPTTEWLKLLCDPRIGLRARTEAAFRQALGETRRAANDVTLWDHCYSTASLYKAALVMVLLERALDEEYEFPPPSTIGWRFLRVGVDGLGFFGQAHHVTDILGRKEAMAQALDKVRLTLEVDYPLGNEVYRDENGSVFIMPALSGAAHKELVEEVRSLIWKTFRRTEQGLEVGNELVPHLVWNDEGPVRRKRDNIPGMVEACGKLIGQAPGPASADPQAMGNWWREAQSVGKEICTVCGVRPVGYKPEGVRMPKWVTSDKAEKRHVCCVCLHRRGRRAKKWLTKEPHRTIWADEVVDVNGRLALIVGHFGLDQWLDGTLVRTMLSAFYPKEKEPEKRSIRKNPSPARVRRVWETTQSFWERVQKEEIPNLLGEQRPRMAITPRHKEKLADPDPKKGLGRYHTYELRVGGSSIGVVWDPEGEELILTEYLRDLDRRLGLPKESWQDESSAVGAMKSWLERHARNGSWPLLEPSGYLSPAAETGHAIEMECAHDDVSRYIPHIPLLNEPALFMALVPADKAMDVVSAIKEKYEREMAKVRDRLPLHLGVIFAPRRTPLAAVLEAGRAMLERDEGLEARGWEKWEVAEKPELKKVSDAPKYLVEGNYHFEEWWDVPLVRNGRQIRLRIGAAMGDGETEDQWYVHLLTRKPKAEGEDFADRPWRRPADLEEGDEIYITPSTFDFEFLDTTARRFEIAYQTSQVSGTLEVRRPSRPTRPFLLDDLERLETLWAELCQLEKSQRHQVIATIEAAREAWFWLDRKGQSLRDGVFRQFVRDTLAGAAWPERRKWKDICQTGLDEQLVTAGVVGELADLAELHMQILKE